MSTSLLDSIQNIVHIASLAVIGIMVAITIAGLLKPRLFKRLFHEFTERKYITIMGVFVCLLSGTIFVATEPMNQASYVSESNKHTIEAVDPLSPQSTPEETSIRIEEVSASEPIAFTKTRTEDPYLPKGQIKITRAGVNGEKQVVYTVTYNKDKEVSRAVKSEQIVTKPVTEITAIGTYTAPEAQPGPSSQSATPGASPQSAPQSSPEAQNGAQHNPSYLENLCRNSRSWLCGWLR